MKVSFIIVFLLICTAVAAQDTLYMKNKDYMTGEIKTMDRGVLTIETDYSKSDFKVEWKEVEKINTSSTFLITLTDGVRLSGSVHSTDSTRVTIKGVDGSTAVAGISELVYLNSLSKKFWDRLDASISLGYSITKAENLRQFSLRSQLAYKSERWTAEVSYNGLTSHQDETETIERNDGTVVFNVLLPEDWFIPTSISFLSNTEQNLDARYLTKLGVGRFLVHRNSAYWGFAVGLSGNLERFTDEEPDRRSLETFFGTELNLFDIGDFSFLFKGTGYPSLTEKGRFRGDLSLDTKYEFPLDFYIQLGGTLNYDSQPAEGGASTDYVFQATLGWSW
jgi:hypothetical protein